MYHAVFADLGEEAGTLVAARLADRGLTGVTAATIA